MFHWVPYWKTCADSLYEMSPGDYKLTVRRRHVFRDALIAFQTGLKPISVTFIGEPAVDEGGPC